MTSARIPLLNWVWTSLLPLALIGNSCAFECNTCFIERPCKVQKCPDAITMVSLGTDLVCTSAKYRMSGFGNVTLVKDCWPGETFNAAIGGGDRCGEITYQEWDDLNWKMQDDVFSIIMDYPVAVGILNVTDARKAELQDEYYKYHETGPYYKFKGRSASTPLKGGKVRLCSCSEDLCNMSSPVDDLAVDYDDDDVTTTSSNRKTNANANSTTNSTLDSNSARFEYGNLAMTILFAMICRVRGALSLTP